HVGDVGTPGGVVGGGRRGERRGDGLHRHSLFLLAGREQRQREQRGQDQAIGGLHVGSPRVRFVGGQSIPRVAIRPAAPRPPPPARRPRHRRRGGRSRAPATRI